MSNELEVKEFLEKHKNMVLRDMSKIQRKIEKSEEKLEVMTVELERVNNLLKKME